MVNFAPCLLLNSVFFMVSHLGVILSNPCTSQMMEAQMAHQAWAWVDVFSGAPIVPSPSRAPDSHGRGITFWAQPAHLSLLLQGIRIPTTRSNYSPPPPWATFFWAVYTLFPPVMTPRPHRTLLSCVQNPSRLLL